MGRSQRTWIPLALALLFPAGLAAQATGTVTGRVVDEATGQALASVQVSIVGTSRGGLTNAEGRYLVPAVPTGEHTVRATLIGYGTVNQTVIVSAGQTAEANFRLSQSAIELGAVVATATGRQQTKREIGSDVGVIQVDQVSLGPVKRFSDLIQGRAAGVTVVQSAGQTGSGSRIRIRGSNSVSLQNSPLLVIDGVRVDDTPNSFGLFTGGQAPSRLDDLNPEEIESIEILKGPAASALYGTAAANGVIQVTTKRGQAGEARWRFWAEGNSLERNYEFPDNIFAVDASDNRCGLMEIVAGSCTDQATTYTFNPLENEETTPFRTGTNQAYGMSVSGGSDAATYFVSGEFSDETGVTEENEGRTVNLRANLSGQVRENLNVSARVGYLDRELQLPQNDNSGIGVLLNGMLGRPTPTFVDNDQFQGYRLPREYLFAWDQFQDVSRLTGSASANWQPLDWLSFHGTAGIDYVSRHDNDLLEPNVLTLFGPPFSSGFRESSQYDIFNYTGTLDATATYALTDDLYTTTSVGTQYFEDRTQNVFASGTDITPGTGSLAGATSNFQAGETNTNNVTIGTYAQEQLAWRDRIFLNVAVRGDRNSAFGTNLGWIWYPAVSGSWIVSEEDFFPAAGLISELRLRAAWGQSGLRPQFRQAVQFYGAVTAVTAAGEEPGFVISGAGNPDLEPERSTELELGLDASLLQDRFGLELTYYDKKSEDALVNRPLAPSLGATTGRFENVGEVKNSGLEAGLRANVVRTEMVDWSLRAAFQTNDNELVSLGENPPIVFGFLTNTQRHQEGYPLGGYWQTPIESYADSDGDGFVDQVTMADSAEFLGRIFPETELSFSTDLRVTDYVLLSGLLDYKGGHKIFNLTEFNRCTAVNPTCEAAHVANSDPELQAAILAYANHSSAAGFIDDAAFWRLREISATLTAPRDWVNTLRLADLRLTLSGRNLATWTDYRGIDPEVSGQAQANFTSVDDFTLPPLRTWTARVDLTF